MNARPQPLPRIVLNAFRHHRQDHPMPVALVPTQIVCSTPFGITDKITRGAADNSNENFSAQRLSASQTRSQRHSLLNFIPFIRAQRLSASQTRSRLLVPAPPHAIASAQRLSASQTRSLQDFASRAARRWVLNAFRHHRQDHISRPGMRLRRGMCSTPFGITDKITSLERAVLAVLAQCSTPFGITDKITARPRRDAVRTPACSTPFGITDKITQWTRKVAPTELEVLNAFRHHRQDHAANWAGPPRRRHGAQRLSASQTRSPQEAGEPLVDVGEVLNAFRHHRQDHWSGAPRRGRPARGAQRLSASQTRSRRKSSARSPVSVCSTPFGITDKITPAAVRVLVSEEAVLNAFRHHRQDHCTDAARIRRAIKVLNAFRHHRQDHGVDGQCLRE